MKEEDEYKSDSNAKYAQMLCSPDDILNQILSEVQEIKTCMNSRLTSLELKVSFLVQTCEKISTRVEALEKNNSQNISVDDGLSNEICEEIAPSDAQNCVNDSNKESGRLKVIPLSAESDYPNGSWLGNPKSPSSRVRCNISPQNLFHINATCPTPEKMALSLIDHLFTREELAVSNISGRSRWGKKQLNPFLIYGIKAHLKYKFLITEKDWQKISQNIDAKCRFAWKRNQKFSNHLKGKFKSSSRRVAVKDSKSSSENLSSNEEINFDFDHLHNSNMDFNSCVKVITQAPCELRILNATPAQIAHLQESQEIILAEEMLPSVNESKPLMITNNAEVIMDRLGSDLTTGQHSMRDSKVEQTTEGGSHSERNLTLRDASIEVALHPKATEGNANE